MVGDKNGAARTLDEMPIPIIRQRFFFFFFFFFFYFPSPHQQQRRYIYILYINRRRSSRLYLRSIALKSPFTFAAGPHTECISI
jgi:hypothetical protein